MFLSDTNNNLNKIIHLHVIAGRFQYPFYWDVQNEDKINILQITVNL